MSTGSSLTPDEIAAVRKPYRAASLLPGRAYHDPAIHKFERKEWFRRDWVVVGREEDAAAPGAYFLATVDDEALEIVHVLGPDELALQVVDPGVVPPRTTASATTPRGSIPSSTS